MSFQPPFYKRLQRKFPQPEEKKPEEKKPEEVEAADPESETAPDPDPTLEEKLADWDEDIVLDGEEDEEEGLSFDDPETPEIEWSESQLKAELYAIATSLDLDVNDDSLKRDIVDALRSSDKATEV